MLRWLTDEDFNGRIVRGLRLQNNAVDLVRLQEVGLSGAEDPRILEWADSNDRLLLSHDASTMPGHVSERLARGEHVPGVFIVDDSAPIGACIDDIRLVDECSNRDEWRDLIFYLPFR